MYLKKNKRSSGRVYLSIADGYRDKHRGHSRTKNIESLGYLDELQKQYDDNIIEADTCIGLQFLFVLHNSGVYLFYLLWYLLFVPFWFSPLMLCFVANIISEIPLMGYFFILIWSFHYTTYLVTK
jgi:hypothetical protein